MQWSAESVWISLFTQPGADPEPYLLFQEAFGSAPDTIQPAEGMPPGKRAAKVIGADAAVLVARPGRIDIVLEPAQASDAPPQLSDTNAALDMAAGATSRILGQLQVVRVSCIMNLMQLLTDPQTSAQSFSKATGIGNIDTDAQDLVFQTNVIAQTPHGLPINRIVRWATAMVQFLQFTVGPGGQSLPQVGKQWFQLTKTLDYNTVPQTAPLSAEAAAFAVSDLVDEVRTTMSKDG